MAQTRQPERLCVGCRQLHPKIVRSPEGAIAVDPTGKSPGRGSYLCPSAECLRQARRQKGLSWSFKGRVDASVYDALEEVLRQYEGGRG